MVIPFKGGSHKSRLARVMNKEERAKLSLLMLQGVLDAFEKAGLIRACHLVSSDEDALRLALARGAKAVRETSNRGVNAATRRGIAQSRASEFLIVPADLPLLRAAEIDRALSFKTEGVDVVISPSSSFDGTNLLIVSRDKMPKLSYDRNSFWNHISSAARMGLSVAVYTGSGVMFDVDTEVDLKRLAGFKIGQESASFAGEVLRSWGS